MSFDDPERLRMTDVSIYAGGEVDPITGEFVYYKNTNAAIDESQTEIDALTEEEKQKRLEAWDESHLSIQGGTRQNPIFASSGAARVAIGANDDDVDYSVSSDEDERLSNADLVEYETDMRRLISSDRASIFSGSSGNYRQRKQSMQPTFKNPPDFGFTDQVSDDSYSGDDEDVVLEVVMEPDAISDDYDDANTGYGGAVVGDFDDFGQEAEMNRASGYLDVEADEDAAFDAHSRQPASLGDDEFVVQEAVFDTLERSWQTQRADF